MSGFLVDSVEECADRLRELLGDEQRRAAMGAAGREQVQRRFLAVRELTDYLELFSSL